MEPSITPAIEAAPRRAFRYWYDDGLVEIGAGLLFLLMAAMFAIEGLVPPGTLPPLFSAFGLPIMVLGGMLVLSLALRAVKQRLTYPRTGYVAYPPTRPIRKVLAGILGGVVSLLLMLLLLSHPEWETALPAVQGAAVAVVWFLLSVRMGVPRMAAQGLLALAAGIIVSLLGLATQVGTAVVFGAIGLGSLISGVLVLGHYLRTTAPPVAEA